MTIRSVGQEIRRHRLSGRAALADWQGRGPIFWVAAWEYSLDRHVTVLWNRFQVRCARVWLHSPYGGWWSTHELRCIYPLHGFPLWDGWPNCFQMREVCFVPLDCRMCVLSAELEPQGIGTRAKWPSTWLTLIKLTRVFGDCKYIYIHSSWGNQPTYN